MSNNYTDHCSMNNDFSLYVVYISGVVCIPVVCVGLIEILIIFRAEKLHNTANMFVFSLAINDILLALAFFVNQSTVSSLPWASLFKTYVASSLVYGASVGICGLSTIHMSIIALDRCIKIAHPFIYTKYVTQRCVYKILVCAWLLCLIFMFTPTLVYNLGNHYDKCFALNPPLIFQLLDSGSYWVNCVVIFLCYFKIGCVAFNHKRASNHRRQQQIGDTQGEIVVNKNFVAAIKSVKFFALMFGVFFAFTLPPMVTGAMDYLGVMSNNVAMGFFTLIPIYSVINFLVYIKMNKDFRKAFNKTLSTITEVFRMIKD
jgi:hypothetical protein